MASAIQTNPFDDRISELIGHVYRAATGEAGWAGVAGSIASALGSTSAVVKLHGPDDAVHLLECTGNLAMSDEQQSWAEHWHRHDLWVERSAAFGMSCVVTDHDLVSAEEQRNSGFYQEWLRALDIHHMVGAVFPGDDGTLGVLGIHRPKRAGAYTDTDRRNVALLLPHLQGALGLGRKLAGATARQMAAEEMLARIDAAIFVVDRHCRVMTLNTRAEAQLRDDDCGLAIRHGRLALEDPSRHVRLVRAIQAAVATASERPMPADAAMAVSRNDRLPLTLLVAPLHADGPASFTQPRALVIVRDPEAATLATSCLRELFGLTRTEATIAADLASGIAVDELAASRGVGTATMRSHVKSILSKTGTHRLAEAVALVARSVAGLVPRD